MRSESPRRVAHSALSALVFACLSHTGACAAVIQIDAPADRVIWTDDGSRTDVILSLAPANDLARAEGVVAGNSRNSADGWRSMSIPETATWVMFLLWGGGFILARTRRYRSTISID